MNVLLEKFMKRRSKAPTRIVTVYTRTGCGCCEKAMAVLKQAQSKHRLTIETIDIDTDPALVEAYGQYVPVVSIAGKVRFRGVVNPVLLERILRATD